MAGEPCQSLLGASWWLRLLRPAGELRLVRAARGLPLQRGGLGDGAQWHPFFGHALRPSVAIATVGAQLAD
eukprot:2805055-Alexandrium_andersonii.AAC.1